MDYVNEESLNTPSKDMLILLDRLKKDIDSDIERRKQAYIGKDSKDYYDKKSLDIANKEYIERMYSFIGKDNFYVELGVPQSNMNEESIIDIYNFPQDMPDNETCKLLDSLYSMNRLTSRKVNYCITSTNQNVKMTDTFDEYNYNGRKFIRVEPKTAGTSEMRLSNNEEIIKGKSYWIEVKPVDLSENKILYVGFDGNDIKRKK